jgi:hypothetical protein
VCTSLIIAFSTRVARVATNSSSHFLALDAILPDFAVSYACLSLADCRDGSDENPSFCATFDCTSTFPLFGSVTRFKCPGTNVCVTGALCDGSFDCPVSVLNSLDCRVSYRVSSWMKRPKVKLYISRALARIKRAR